MNRSQIITEIKNYFKLQELVCPHVYRRYGERAWQFLSTTFLHTLLIVRRDIIQNPMVCNNYHKGGLSGARGLRCNMCNETQKHTAKGESYVSAHIAGEGADFTLPGITAQAARDKIAQQANKLPYPIRLERDVSWLHLDVYDSNNGQIISYFSA